MPINPEMDGIDHINIYSKGKTALGRWLSNFTECDLELPEGKFKSIEGYWYYLLSPEGLEREQLKHLTGYIAKNFGRSIKAKDWSNDNIFKTKIKFALFTKLINNEERFKELKGLTLPLKHYYNYSGKVVEPKEGKWILDFLNKFQSEIKNVV